MSKPTHITKNEAIVLNMIARNYFQTDLAQIAIEGRWGDSGIWSEQIEDTSAPEKVSGRTLSGVCGSLAVKGLVSSDYDGEDSTIALTEAGFLAWQSHISTDGKGWNAIFARRHGLSR